MSASERAREMGMALVLSMRMQGTDLKPSSSLGLELLECKCSQENRGPHCVQGSDLGWEEPWREW